MEFFDVPLTPSFRPKSLISDDEVPVPPVMPSALLENLEKECPKESKQYKSTGKLLGRGNWGSVYEVKEQGPVKPGQLQFGAFI